VKGLFATLPETKGLKAEPGPAHGFCPDTRTAVFPSQPYLSRTDGGTGTFLPIPQVQREPGTREDPEIFLLFRLPFFASLLQGFELNETNLTTQKMRESSKDH
jgi:hypothetical protein